MLEAISVSQLNGYIKGIFEAEELLHNIPVVGEIFGVSFSRQVVYFSLKDETASLPCVCFFPALTPLIQEGQKVIVTGSPNFYAKGGKLNFNVTKVESLGQGKLYEDFLKLKQKLELEGLFDASHKKAMPSNIKRIGVVTSKDGAVLQDIKNITWRRNPSIDIVLYSTKVQGLHAEDEIAHAIDIMDKQANVDVIVVARGGGSLEDLSAYNTEKVARATYLCEKPIISAVGHETDFTIIDFVSDLRAPTPSAAAELLTYNLEDKKKEAFQLIQKFIGSATYYWQERHNDIYRKATLMQNVLEKICLCEKACTQQRSHKLITLGESYLAQKMYEAGLQENTLKKLNPKAILQQGYAKVEQEGKAIPQASDVDMLKTLTVIFADGQLDTKPLKKEK